MSARKNFILKQYLIIIMSTVTLCTSCQSQQCQLFPLYGHSFFSPRSQSLDAPRDLVGTHRFLHRSDTNSYYGAVSVTPQYMHSYKKDNIAEYFFGTNLLHIAGSQVSSRTAETILADYFGLSPTFESTVEVNPSIANFVGDIGFYGQWKRLYAMVHIPITWTKWEFNLCETIQNKGTDTPFPAKYMSTTELTAPITSFARALKGGVTFGDLKQGFCYGIVDCPQTKTGVADIRTTIGYDIWLREHGHAGFYVHCALPTGNRSKARYLFEPILDNGHHWEIGLGFNGRVLIWEADGDQTLSLFFDGKITHLFKSRQCRSFDFCNNCFGSRYTLLKQFDGHGNYTGNLVPAINITTLPCDVVIDSQFDIVAMIGYLYRGFEFDAGYNAWARTREKITLYGCIEPRRYGFKGIQNVVSDTGLPSAVTQHTATLHGNLFEDQSQIADDPSPHYINTCDLDPSSAASERSFTHKLFIYLGYAWNTQETNTLMPFIGIGGSVEFEGVYPDYIQPNKNSLSQYSIWLKGGTGF
jgi:hypothetical protein